MAALHRAAALTGAKTVFAVLGGTSLAKPSVQGSATAVGIAKKADQHARAALKRRDHRQRHGAGQITVRTDGHANANAANFADVVTYNSAGTPTDLPFNVAVFC